MHGALAAGPLDHHHLLVAERFGQRLVGIVLELDLPAAAQSFIGGDDELRLAIGDAAGKRVWREAAEHHGVNGADPRAGEHGVGRLRDHGQIDGDAVAAADAHGEQHIGEHIHLAVKLAIGDVARGLGRIVRLPDDGDLMPALLQMPVDAIGADIERAVLEPFDRDVRVGEARVLDDAVGLDPIDPLALFAPELVRLLDALAILLLVLVLVDEGLFLPVLRNLVDSFLRHRPAPPYALRSPLSYEACSYYGRAASRATIGRRCRRLLF